MFQVQEQLKITFRMRTLKIKCRSSQDTADKPVLLTVIDMEITTFSTTFKTTDVTLEYNSKLQNTRLWMPWLIGVTAGKFWLPSVNFFSHLLWRWISRPYILQSCTQNEFCRTLTYYIRFPPFHSYVLVEILAQYFNYSSEMDSSKIHRNAAHLHVLAQWHLKLHLSPCLSMTKWRNRSGIPCVGLWI